MCSENLLILNGEAHAEDGYETFENRRCVEDGCEHYFCWRHHHVLPDAMFAPMQRQQKLF